MQRMRVLAAEAAAFGSQFDELVAAHAPDVIALIGVGPARASSIAGARGMRAATQGFDDANNAGLALMWKSSLAVESLDRFEFGQIGEPCGALRITFPLDGRFTSVYCAQLSSDAAVAGGQQARLAALIDSVRKPALAACAGVVVQPGARWSRCFDAWTTAQRRIVTLAMPADIGLVVQRAFGIAAGPPVDERRARAGLTWHCSEEFFVLQTRRIAMSAEPRHAVQTAELRLRSATADQYAAIAL